MWFNSISQQAHLLCFSSSILVIAWKSLSTPVVVLKVKQNAWGIKALSPPHWGAQHGATLYRSEVANWRPVCPYFSYFVHCVDLHTFTSTWLTIKGRSEKLLARPLLRRERTHRMETNLRGGGTGLNSSQKGKKSAASDWQYGRAAPFDSACRIRRKRVNLYICVFASLEHRLE